MMLRAPFLASVLACGFLHATANSPTFHFTVSLNNVQDARATNSWTPVEETSSSRLIDKLSQVWIDPATNTNLAQRLKITGSSWLADHKWHLLGASLAGSYIYLCSIIMRGNSYFGKKELWSSWRQDLPLEQLLAIPQQQFAGDLLAEIQRRYTDPAAVTDLVRPLGTFMRTVDQEEELLLWYQEAFSWISYLKLTAIIPFSTVQFTKITERLQRLAYYKNVFQSWTAHYQLEHASRSVAHLLHEPFPDVSCVAHLLAYRYKIALHDYWDAHTCRTIPQ